MALAKLLDDRKPDTPKPASRPKSGEETTEPRHRLDTAALSRMLTSEPPGQRPSTARALSQTASIGAPTASAARMSPSMWGQLDALLQEQYKACWTYLGLGADARYVPQIKVEYASNGALVGQPSLLNPPGDPQSAQSRGKRAARRSAACNPLRIPPQFAPSLRPVEGAFPPLRSGGDGGMTRSPDPAIPRSDNHGNDLCFLTRRRALRPRLRAPLSCPLSSRAAVAQAPYLDIKPGGQSPSHPDRR